MAFWGTGILENDEAREVQGIFKESLVRGESVESIVEIVLGAFEVNEHRDKAENFWMPTYTDVLVYTALSQLLLDNGYRHKEVFKDTLFLLEMEGDLEQWEDTAEYEEREKAFEDLNEAILQAM